MRTTLPRSGFTLVELMVVVTIVAVLATVATIGYLKVSKRQRINEAVAMVGAIHAGESVYKSDFDEYCGFSPNPPDHDNDVDWDPADPSLIAGKSTLWNHDFDWSDCNISPQSHTRFRYALTARQAGTACSNPSPTASVDGKTVGVCASIDTSSHWYYVIAQANQDDDGVFSVLASTSTMTDAPVWSVQGIELE